MTSGSNAVAGEFVLARTLKRVYIFVSSCLFLPWRLPRLVRGTKHWFFDVISIGIIEG